MNKLEIALKVAEMNYNIPYKWGGDNPMAGFDCSGFCVEIGKSAGILDGDYTADGLYQLFKDNKTDHATAGCFIFWGNGSKMTHVEFCISETHTIGASGGGSKTVTVQDAIDQDACIKIRPIRKGYAAIVFPFE